MQKKKNILQNLWKNQEYILYYAKIILKTRVAGSYLGFLWLWIDPLMFMLIYSFVVMFIFKSKIEHFNVFVLIGITAWNFFSRAMLMATTSIVRNKSIFQQVYFHKFVYPTLYLVSYIYEFFISLSLILIVMLFEGIPITWHVIEVIPILITMALFTYGCSLIISHIGVYLFDLRNILDFTLKFIFYLQNEGFTSPLLTLQEVRNSFHTFYMLLTNFSYSSTKSPKPPNEFSSHTAL